MRFYYRLKTDVKNPKPDRRSKDPTCIPVWPAGSLFLHNVPDSKEDGAYIRFMTIPGHRAGYSHIPVWTESGKALLAADKELAEKTLKIIEDEFQLDGRFWLAALIETDKVPIEEVIRIAAAIAESDEESEEGKRFNEMFKKHGL